MKDPAVSKKHCGCVCHRMSGILIFLIGLDFLLGAFDVLSQHVVGVIWPVLLMLFGVKTSLRKGFCKCCSKG